MLAGRNGQSHPADGLRQAWIGLDAVWLGCLYFSTGRSRRGVSKAHYVWGWINEGLKIGKGCVWLTFPPTARSSPVGDPLMPCLELPYVDAQGSPDTIGSIGEGSSSGGCGEGAVTRAEVLFLCPSCGASSQTPAMSRTLLLLLLLLRGLTTGRPPPAATPRLKLSFPGEHGTRAGWGGVGSGVGALVMCQQHPASSRGMGVSWGAAWWEGCKPPALVRPQHCYLPPRGLSGVDTCCHVPYLMPALPGPPACP